MAKQEIHRINLANYTDPVDKVSERLNQIVNVYKHSKEDFIRNFDEMTLHYRKNLGAGGNCSYHILGQIIEFRVVPKQEPKFLPLYKFMINYIMIMPMILLKVDMTDWEPWVPAKFTASGWKDEMNMIIYRCREYCTSYEMCEYISWIKYELNMFVTRVGDLLAHSISNNEFIELMKRNSEVRDSIECKYDIPDDASPDVIEHVKADRTKSLLNIMTEHHDLSCYLYAQTGLFNPTQASELFVNLGNKPDLEGNTISYTYKTNILLGTQDPRAHMTDARGGLKAEYTKRKVADAGTFERAVAILMSHIRWVDHDYNCDSQHFRTKKITKISEIISMDGRVATLDKKHYFIIDPRDKTQHLLGKTIYLKTPITCCHPRRAEGYICSACYGKLLSSVNQDVHVGRISALNDADEMEQVLLSAKHALNTRTFIVEFTDTFDEYFIHEKNRVGLAPAIVDEINFGDGANKYKDIYIEIDPAAVSKRMDGENRNFDRSIDEIVILNKKTNERTVIREKNGIKFYLHPDINEEFYLPAITRNPNDPVLISIVELVETSCYSELFEYQYKNFELSGPLMKINGILNKGNGGIDLYKTYNQCLDDMIPMFIAGGINIPEIHIEMLIACLVFSPDKKLVDWNEENPEYMFCSIDTAIKNSQSILTSLLYENQNQQIAGKYGTYQKTGTSIYDVFLTTRKPK